MTIATTHDHASIAAYTPSPPTAFKMRLQRIRDALTTGLVERDIPIRLALLAALAGEHLLLIGPPGTAKSELARRLRLVFTRQAYFERLPIWQSRSSKQQSVAAQ